MKKLNYILIAALALVLSSCHYLDISPDKGLDEEAVFTTFTNYKAYFEGIYEGAAKKDNDGTALNALYSSFPLRIDANSYRIPVVLMTDLASSGRTGLRTAHIKAGALGEDCNWLVDFRCPIFQGCWHLIRKCNKCIDNIDKLQDAQEQEKLDILAQSYFLRAWFHMTLTNIYGGQPYLEHALGPDDSFDVPRLPAVETYQKCAEDFKKAYEIFAEAGFIRRDGKPGEEGHLTNSKQNYPNGVAAMALRGRCLLYAASPLNNPTNDPQLWKDAADANSEALNLALEYGYELLPFVDWDNNVAFVAHSNEQLWSWSYGTSKSSGGYIVNHLCYAIHNGGSGGGTNPTQNAVDLYETKWGDPLFTQAERDAAYNIIGKGSADGSIGPDGQYHHYYEQNPYVNRDPRFYKNIIFDGAEAVGAPEGINMYYDSEKKTYPTTKLSGKERQFGDVWNGTAGKAVNTTNYYCRKRWDGKYVSASYHVSEPLIRLAEVYLNYAEAANMAYGPNGASEGQISALEAVNIIRNRAEMPDVKSEFTGSAEALNARIQNERTVEFMYEEHHYYIDERRWKIAPERMKARLDGMYIETCPKSNEFPNGKRYVRTPVKEQATWKEPMYYWYLYKEEANKYQYYKNNEPW